VGIDRHYEKINPSDNEKCNAIELIESGKVLGVNVDDLMK